MNIRRIALCVVAVALTSSCSARTASGTYLNRGQGFVELLQITARTDGSLEGTLTQAKLQPSGSLSQDNTPVSGSVDGHAITVIMKAPLSLLPSLNLSGTVDGGVITLTQPNGLVRYTESNAAAYQTALQQMRVQGAAIQKQRHIDDENATVGVLNKRLTSYAAKIHAPHNAKLFEELHATHENALAKARRGLEVQQTYPRGSFQAGQVSVDIGQVDVGLRVFDTPWESTPRQVRSDLRELDAAIAGKPCKHSGTLLSNCQVQPEAIRVYLVAKPIAERGSADIEATLKTDHAAMDAIVKQANDYTR